MARFQHAYDRNSNKRYAADLVLAGKDDLYAYDGLDRLADWQRGTLNGNRDGVVSTAAKQQTWALDSLGNWPGFVEKASGVTTLDQTRAHNAVNELGAIGANQGANWFDPTHDLAGNMASGPKPLAPTEGFNFSWDSWNRLAKVTDSATLASVAEYQYDGLNHRIVKLTPNAGTPANWDRTDYLVTAGWQDLEERVLLNSASKTTAATQVLSQHVYDLRYIDAVAVRDFDTDNNGTLDARHYYCHNSQFSVTALVTTAGSVVERYAYDPYGKATVLDASGAAKTDPNCSEYGNSWTWQGRRLDSETGLMYLRQRMYSLLLGRFASRWVNLLDDVNLYQYQNNAPTIYTDPMGDPGPDVKWFWWMVADVGLTPAEAEDLHRRLRPEQIRGKEAIRRAAEEMKNSRQGKPLRVPRPWRPPGFFLPAGAGVAVLSALIIGGFVSVEETVRSESQVRRPQDTGRPSVCCTGSSGPHSTDATAWLGFIGGAGVAVARCIQQAAQICTDKSASICRGTCENAGETCRAEYTPSNIGFITRANYAYFSFLCVCKCK